MAKTRDMRDNALTQLNVRLCVCVCVRVCESVNVYRSVCECVIVLSVRMWEYVNV